MTCKCKTEMRAWLTEMEKAEPGGLSAGVEMLRKHLIYLEAFTRGAGAHGHITHIHEVLDRLVEQERAVSAEQIYEVIEDNQIAGQWRVEAFDDDGACHLTIFCGPGAEDRARRYAEIMNG